MDPDSNDRDQNSHVVLPDGTAYGLVYDGPGQSLRRIAGDKQGHEIDFVNSSLLGVLSQTVTAQTTYFLPIPGGRVLAEKTGASEVDYLVDGLGSTVRLADSTGSLVSRFRYSYDPYGNQRTSEPTGYPTPKLGFAGGYRDATGFLKFGARYYDPTTGRWTQPDPINQPLDQHGWNRYTYVGDDPINFVDPNGMSIAIGTGGSAADRGLPRESIHAKTHTAISTTLTSLASATTLAFRIHSKSLESSSSNADSQKKVTSAYQCCGIGRSGGYCHLPNGVWTERI